MVVGRRGPLEHVHVHSGGQAVVGTVTIPAEEIGRKAVELLLEGIFQAERRTSETLMIELSLRVRGSTAPPVGLPSRREANLLTGPKRQTRKPKDRGPSRAPPTD